AGGVFNARYSLIEKLPEGTINGENDHNIFGKSALIGLLRDNGGPTKTHALLPGTPAINMGNNELANGLATDQRGEGFPRIVGDSVDIGAFEFSRFPRRWLRGR